MALDTEFVVDDGDIHSVTSVNVYIKAVRIRYPKGLHDSQQIPPFHVDDPTNLEYVKEFHSLALFCDSNDVCNEPSLCFRDGRIC